MNNGSDHGSIAPLRDNQLTILLALALLAIPLTNARAASVCEYSATNGFQISLETVALNSGVDELGSVNDQVR